jgi:hypothetical protein
MNIEELRKMMADELKKAGVEVGEPKVITAIEKAVAATTIAIESGSNIITELKDGKIMLCIDPQVDCGLSASTGKTILVANSRGTIKVPVTIGGRKTKIYISVNAYRYP